MSHAANPKRNINEGQIRSERAQAKGPKPTNPCERPFENDRNRPFPNDSHKRKFEGESSQANISSESQKANVIMRISRRSFQANVPSDSFQTTVRTRLFPSGNTHTKVLKRLPRTPFSERSLLSKRFQTNAASERVQVNVPKRRYPSESCAGKETIERSQTNDSKR